MDGPDTTLTVRESPFGKGWVVPRRKWRLKGNVVPIDGGFEPGRTYEVAFRAENPPVAGLGLAAVRDVVGRAVARAGAPPRHVRRGFVTERPIPRTFLLYGFNTDEKDRPVFDGVTHRGGRTARPERAVSRRRTASDFQRRTAFPLPT